MSQSKQSNTYTSTEAMFDHLQKTPIVEVTYHGTNTNVISDDDLDAEGQHDLDHRYHGYGTIIQVAFAFLLVFIGYVGTEALQTHINSEAGLGTTTIAIVYGCFYLSCFGFGPAIIGHFGPKWPVVIGWICYALFVVANFYPRTWTLYPAAALIGFAGGPVWISMGVYTTSLAMEHASLNKKPREQVLSLFNGMFISIFFFQYPVSAFISSLVFIVADIYENNGGSKVVFNITSTNNMINSTITTSTSSVVTQAKMLFLNNRTHLEEGATVVPHTFPQSNPLLSTPTSNNHTGTVCGARYCSYLSSHVAEIHKPDQVFIYVNLAIFLGCVLLGMAVLACQPSVRPPDHRYMSVKTRLKRLLQVLKHWRWLLLAPTFAVCGIMQGMAINTFSQAFVNCTLNIRWVSYVLTLRGIACMGTPFVSGKLAEYIPQWVLLLTGYFIEMLVLLVWLMWTPSVSLAWVFFIVLGAEGIGAGCLRVHATALLGYLFPSDQEVAFAHLNMVIALATCFIMMIANFLCFGSQTFLALGTLGVAMICYIILNIWLRQEEAQTTKIQLKPAKNAEKK